MPKQLPTHSLQFWWFCLPAMTSAWYFKEPLKNETKNFLISKLCFSWLVHILTPSNSTHYYLISSKLPFTTETTKKFPAEKKSTENLRMYSVTWQSTFGEFISPHQRAEIFTYDSKYYSRLVILWTLDTCDFYVELSTMSRAHRKQKKRLIMGMSFHREGECLRIAAKPAGIKKEKDIPRLPEKLKNCIETLDFSISILIKILQ